MEHGTILLSKAQRVQRLAARRRWLALLFAATAGFCLGLFLFFTLPVLSTESLRVWVSAVCLALGPILLILVVVFRKPLRFPSTSLTQAAGLLASRRQDVRDLLVTGADLSQWDPDTFQIRGASPGLVHAQIRSATAAAEELDASQALPVGQLTPWSLVLAGSLCLVTAALVADPYGSLTGWRALARALQPAPIMLNSTVYRLGPPAYTGLPETAVENPDRPIRALQGTRVSLESDVSGRIERGLVRPEDGSPVEGTVQDETRFQVSWILGTSGNYRLEFFRAGGLLPLGFSPEPFDILRDQPPEAGLGKPEGDLQVVRDMEIEVSFTADDDYGISRAEVVLSGEEEVRIPVRVKPGTATEGGILVLPLRYEQLGEGAHLSVTVWDNDTVSGPKAGTTRSIYLSFIDRRKIVETIEDLEERLFEALIQHLGDHLETATDNPQALESLRVRAGDLLRLLEELARNLDMDMLMNSPPSVALLSIRTSLESVLRPFIEESEQRAPVISELERDILLLDRLLKNLNMEKALNLGDEISALQRSLYDELENGADPRQMQSLLDRIMELMSRMNQMLSRGAESMPEEFTNADAVQDMPASDLQEALEKLKEALKSGDSEAARKAAEDLLEQMSQWLAALENAAQEAADGATGMMMDNLSALEQDLQQLMNEQEDILDETRNISPPTGRASSVPDQAAAQELMKELNSRLNRISENVRQSEARVPRHSRGWHAPKENQSPQISMKYFETRRRFNEAISEMRNSFRSDMGRSRDLMPYLEGSFEDMYAEFESMATGSPDQAGQTETLRESQESGLAEIEALAERLDELLGGSPSGLSEEALQQLSALGDRQNQLGQDTGEFERKLGDALKKLPFLSPATPEMAGQAGKSMKKASDQLQGGDKPGAMGSESRALEGLSGIAKEFRQARKKMQSSMSGQSGFRMVGRPGGHGSQGQEVDRSRVEIPEEMEARELKGFREDVLKAMRDGRYPKDYEKDVETYYEKLIK